VHSEGRAVPLTPRWAGAILVAVLFCAPLFVGLGQSDFHGDESIYAFGVDVILQTGDWWTPRSIPDETAPFLEKPPLKFWIVAAGIRSGLLPHSEFGQRFWDALFGAIAFLYVYVIGVRLGGPVCGILAVFTLFVHRPLLLVHGLRSHNMEAALLLSYCGGVYHAMAWSSARSPLARTAHVAAVVFFFVLGLMTKFVAVAFLPAILILTCGRSAAWRARLREDWLAWTAAAAAGVAVVAPWFVYQSAVRGDELWHVLLTEHVYRRMTSFLEPAHVQPWDFYLTAIHAEIANNKTIVPVICGAIALAVVTVRRRWDPGMLVLSWFIVPVTAISFGTSKLYHYTYPFLPPLGIAAGYLPALLLGPDPLVTRGFARLRALPTVRGWTDRVRRHVQAFRWMAAGLAVPILVLAVVTLLNGRVVLEIGDLTLLRNSSVVRPALLGTALLLIARGASGGSRGLVTLLLLAVLPLGAYAETLGLLTDGRAPVRSLAECLDDGSGRSPRAVYVHADDPGYWEYVYYFRRVGWQHPRERSVDILPRKLFIPEEQQPVLLSVDDYTRLERALAAGQAGSGHSPEIPTDVDLGDVPRVQLDSERFLLLPGEYARCAARATDSR
jgi:4-amino-4-deoxy-L-arabinose transferase-like glycosyltransferase